MSTLKRAAAREVLQENLARLFVGTPDHAKAQEETAECIFLVVHDLLLRRDTLLGPCHQAEFTDELGICLCRLIGDRAVQPCEGDAIIGERVGHLANVKGVPNEPPLAQEERVQILQCVSVKRPRGRLMERLSSLGSAVASSVGAGSAAVSV